MTEPSVRQNQFKLFNPDLKCCRCMCGGKFKLERINNTSFTWDDPSGGTSSNVSIPNTGSWFGGLIFGKLSRLASTGWEFQWNFAPGGNEGSTQRQVQCLACLVPVIVLKNGKFIRPDDSDCITSPPGPFPGINQFKEFYDDDSREVFDGGGFYHGADPPELTYFGTTASDRTDCDIAIPDDLKNACARIDYYAVGHIQVTDRWENDEVSDLTSIITTEVMAYHSSVCEIESLQDPSVVFTRSIGVYYSERLVDTVILSTVHNFAEFPSQTSPTAISGNGIVATPAVNISVNYQFLPAVKLVIGDIEFEEFDPCPST